MVSLLKNIQEKKNEVSYVGP